MVKAEIIMGVTGGIAAYKSAALVSHLVQANYGVRVVMTPSAHQFIGQATMAALTGRPVYTEIFAGQDAHPLGPHIEFARDADLLCVAPATADFLGKAANGLADSLLSTLYLCFQGPVLMAPAMNCEMWEKPAVQRNIETLRSDGVHLIGPNEGWLSCRQKGAGRMSEPLEIAEQIVSVLKKPN
ncbi:MAG: flavoprotein [Pirellulaceae bacterium]|nr:flavoprotein [Pirellulaceae bacterium]